METLNKIQRELKAPKSQFNAFGKFNYRKCEDILEAVKPLLGKATLVITDDVVLIGNRFYVKAVATLTEGDKSVSATAFARESEEKKGMDTAMVTGASSSYARKYALSGLFCIDDNADADVTHEGKDTVIPEKVAEIGQRTVNTPIVGKVMTPNCPVCGQPMKSTAQAKASGKMKANGPMFTCADYKNCKGVIWAEKKAAVAGEGANAHLSKNTPKEFLIPEIDLGGGVTMGDDRNDLE